MSNIEILPAGSGADRLRVLIRNLVAIPAEHDPRILSPPSECFALGTARGKIRDRNEDRLAVMRVYSANGVRPWMLFAVSDGIGGMIDGGRAAEIALGAFLSNLLSSRLGSTAENMRQSSYAANHAVYAELRGRGGATLSAVAWDCSRLIILNIGDSRIWAVRKTAIEQWTRDDSIAGQLEAHGVAEAADARRDLLQFVGIGEEMNPHIEGQTTEKVRYVLATTDGAHDLPTNLIGRILQGTSLPGEAVSRLLDLSLWCGGADNASVICFQPTSLVGGTAGTVELWTPSGYWRVVRGDIIAPTDPAVVVPGYTPNSPAHTDQTPVGKRKGAQSRKSERRPERKNAEAKKDKQARERAKNRGASPLFNSDAAANSENADSGSENHVMIDIPRDDDINSPNPDQRGLNRGTN